MAKQARFPELDLPRDELIERFRQARASLAADLAELKDQRERVAAARKWVNRVAAALAGDEEPEV